MRADQRAAGPLLDVDRLADPAQVYEAYFGPAIFGPLSERVLVHAAPGGADDVLDVACGTGILTRRLASASGHAARVVGVDINPAMLEVASSVADREGHRIEWRQGDGTALDLPDAAFSLITCQQGLQFFPERAAGARQLRRVLRDGGRAVVAVWQGLDRHPLYAALADAEVPHLAAFGVPVTYEEVIQPFSLGDPDELRDLLLDGGFRRVEVVQDVIGARFPDADRFVEHMEYAYAAVVPTFMHDPDAFAAYLAAIDQDTKEIVERYRDGDHIVVPMHTNIAIAHA